MEKNSFGKKPEGRSTKPEAKQMAAGVEPNRARIEAKIAEMKAELESKLKK